MRYEQRYGPPYEQASAKEIPYDHVAVLRLLGRAGNRVEDTVNISVDGAFVATSIGYSFIPAPPTGGIIEGQAITLPPPFDALVGAAFNDPADAARCLFARFCGIDFTYSIIDSGTGRELQNRAIHNIAGLGSPDGARPFRPMAKPMLFLPRSTIRIVVDEVSEGPLFEGAQLFFVLHGYKMLGYLP
ncbi:hypothetical protein [Streptomyces sp. PA5.6]|uniref:hypothetical protein n=1 Tax=Streptomyces sp. PA5.6 TaxID=3035651 RepID=UPI0039048142